MLRRHIVLLVAIHPSDEDVKPGCPLGAFREEQAMSRHWVSPSPFLSSSSSSSSSYTTQLRNTYSHPNLNFLQYTIQILVAHVMWCAQVVHELKIDHTQRHLSAFRGTRSTQVQWVGIGTYTFMYLQYRRPPYLSPFTKCVEGIVHHQCVHLC